MVDDPHTIAQFWEQLINRPSGPLAFRFVLQPVMASILAIVDGVHDARASRSPYFWLLLHEPEHRYERLMEAVTRVGRVLIFAVVMDVAYTLLVFRSVFPLETLVIAVVLALLPYVIMRGPANRIARSWIARTARRDSKK